MARFTGKSVIVTGAASGIGRASAKLFAAEGASVIAAQANGVADSMESFTAMLLRVTLPLLVTTNE